MSSKDVQDAIQKAFLREGEIVVGWVLTMEVAEPDGAGYLAHRAGGGVDGGNPPSLWGDLGMTEARAGTVKALLAESTGPPRSDDE